MRSWHIAEPRRVAVEKFTRASRMCALVLACANCRDRTGEPDDLTPQPTQALCFYELRLASVTVRRCVCSETNSFRQVVKVKVKVVLVVWRGKPGSR